MNTLVCVCGTQSSFFGGSFQPHLASCLKSCRSPVAVGCWPIFSEWSGFPYLFPGQHTDSQLWGEESMWWPPRHQEVSLRTTVPLSWGTLLRPITFGGLSLLSIFEIFLGRILEEKVSLWTCDDVEELNSTLSGRRCLPFLLSPYFIIIIVIYNN